MERSQGMFVCMVGVALASFAGRIPSKERKSDLSGAPHRPAVRFEEPAAPSARLGGSYLARIDGRVLRSPHPPVGEPLTLMVPGTPHPVRAVQLDLQDRHAPYYLDDDGRMLETEWRLEGGTMTASVRYRRGMLEIPAPS